MSFSLYNSPLMRKFSGTAPRVRMQIFPLAADRTTLDHFVERWFNANIPPEVAVFSATAPVVICTLLTYEDLSDADRVRTGIYAQNELYFLVMMERYRLEDGGLRFVEHGATTPFIYVDSPDSAMIGRDRCGFPKELCTFTPGVEEGRVPWAPDARPIVSLRVWQPGKLAPERTELVSVVSNVRRSVVGLDDATGRLVPPDPAELTRNDVLWWVQSVIKEAATARTGVAPATRHGTAKIAETLSGELKVTTFNLRQMPDPTRPPQALYRDLIRLPLRLNRLQEVRLFSEDGSTSARPLSLFVRRRALNPIVEQLGLHVTARERRAGPEGDDVWDVIDPISPLYLQGDILLGEPSRLCWQYDDSGWRTTSGFHRRTTPGPPRAPLVDDFVGASTRLISGRQATSPERDAKVLIVAAHADLFTRYMAERIPHDSGLQIRPWVRGGFAPVRIAFNRPRPRTGARGPLVWQDGVTMSVSAPVSLVVDGVERHAMFRILDCYDNPMAVLVAGTVYAGANRFVEFDRSTFDWFSSSSRQRRHIGVRASIRDERSQEVRVRHDTWLDLVSDVVDKPIRLSGLDAGLVDEVDGIRDRLHLAGIADPDPREQWVHERIALTEVDYAPLGEPLAQPPDRAYWLRVRPTTNLDMVREFGLVTTTSAAVDSIAKAQSPAWPELVPVVGLRETSQRSSTRNVRILWRRHGRRPPRQGPS